MKKIVLASASPRRKEILMQLGLEFEVIASDIKEYVDPKLTPEEIAKSLSFQKANNIAQSIGHNCLVIGSDTIVVIDDEILGKPKNDEDVYCMLRKLSKKVHKVITGVCIIDTSNGSSLIDYDISLVKMRNIQDEEIKYYIQSKEPFGKAGSYAIQGLGGIFVESIEGSYSGIVGLPVYLIDKMLKHYGVNILGENKHLGVESSEQ